MKKISEEVECFVTGTVFDLWTRWKDAEKSQNPQASDSFEPEHIDAGRSQPKPRF